MVDQATETRALLSRLLDQPLDAVGASPVAGRVHDHWAVGTDCLVRIPKFSHLGLTPRRNLAYQAQAFRRCAPGGATPKLRALLRVGPGLPWGALVVDRIAGRVPRMPGDLPAIARALGAVHGLPIPDAGRRAPILDPDDPVGYLIGVVRGQLQPVRAALPQPARRILEQELAEAQALASRSPGRPASRLALADTHPGNFRILADGTAVMVDVERPVYDSPAVDLAHASLPTSLSWDPAVSGTAGREHVAGFHRAWAASVPAAVAEAVRPWVLAYRRLVWLRTTSWACAWAARNDLSAALASPEPGTAGLARRLARFLDLEMMERARAQWRGADAYRAEELIP